LRSASTAARRLPPNDTFCRWLVRNTARPSRLTALGANGAMSSNVTSVPRIASVLPGERIVESCSRSAAWMS
jgi:hypothetical protein